MRKLTPLAVLVLAAIGCHNGNNNNSCMPMAQECVSDQLARVCPADGSGWLSISCGPGTKCSNGVCAPDAGSAQLCQVGTGSCGDSTHALQCNENGVGFKATSCPANTQCINQGLCQGACIVGDTLCDGAGGILTCMDGNTYMSMVCPAGQYCTTQTPTPFGVSQAACQAAACQPGASTCGNPLDMTADQTKFRADCVATPTGYNWNVEQCLTGQSCDPTSGGHPCSAQCQPNTARCSGQNIQICDAATLSWKTTSTCDVASSQSCLLDGNGNPVCGDKLCALGAQGTCVQMGGSSLFRACGSDGKLGAPAPCGQGVCATDLSPTVNGVTAGSCHVQCNAGEQRCWGKNAYQTCTNGVWSTATTACPSTAGVQCKDVTQPNNMHTTVCGVCQPGTNQCVNASGSTSSGAPYDHIETCDNSGMWGALTACTVGTCVSGGATGAYCHAMCAPGQPVCVGSVVAVPGTTITNATTASGTCNPDGSLPAGTACATGLYCRHDWGGNALGCVACVGSTTNEAGTTDTRCTDSTGGQTAPANAAVEMCSASNAWGGVMMCPSSPAETCQHPQTSTCQPCFGSNGGPCSDSQLAANGFGGCQWWWGVSTQPCGQTTDCCANAPYLTACGTTTSPTAVCSQ
jgi:hypothetical protein